MRKEESWRCDGAVDWALAKGLCRARAWVWAWKRRLPIVALAGAVLGGALAWAFWGAPPGRAYKTMAVFLGANLGAFFVAFPVVRALRRVDDLARDGLSRMGRAWVSRAQELGMDDPVGALGQALEGLAQIEGVNLAAGPVLFFPLARRRQPLEVQTLLAAMDQSPASGGNRQVKAWPSAWLLAWALRRSARWEIDELDRDLQPAVARNFALDLYPALRSRIEAGELADACAPLIARSPKPTRRL